MLMVSIICLANSWKRGDRCIAGIDPNTGEWIRPVSQLEDGRIPTALSIIDGEEITPLDIIDVPLAETGSDFGFAKENRLVLSGKWQRIGRATPAQLMKYCGKSPAILHNHKKYVSVADIQRSPRQCWNTLQLVYATDFALNSAPRREGGWKWYGTLITQYGQQLNDAAITDPVLVERLKQELTFYPKSPCFVTVSLSMPYSPSDGEGKSRCWKLIAAVIAISDADRILLGMEQVGWSIEQGRSYLQQRYNKQSRSQLTSDEQLEFLNYLKLLFTQS